VNNANKSISLGARVEPELAEAVRSLADAGDRSVSREVRRALLEHVAQASPGGSPPPFGDAAGGIASPAAASKVES
jgi:hypothetical protein